MNRFDLTDASRKLVNAMVSFDVIDAYAVLELGAECTTPAELLENIVEIIAARQHDRDFTERGILINMYNMACLAERGGPVQRAQRAL